MKKSTNLRIGIWGNSLAVRLPSALIQKAALQEGDELEVEVTADGKVHLSPLHRFDREAFLTELDKLHAALPRTESVIEQLRQQVRY